MWVALPESRHDLSPTAVKEQTRRTYQSGDKLSPLSTPNPGPAPSVLRAQAPPLLRLPSPSPHTCA